MLKKTPLSESLFYKVPALRPATLLKRILQYSCFPVNFLQLRRIEKLRTVEKDFPRKRFFFSSAAIHNVFYGIDTIKALSRFPGKH